MRQLLKKNYLPQNIHTIIDNLKNLGLIECGSQGYRFQIELMYLWCRENL